MNQRRLRSFFWILAGLSSMTCLSGCMLFYKHVKTGTPDDAFIAYWPPKEHDGRLRLAVKDLIDVKGVVTTAGSEYISQHNIPARSDAECLRIARARNVEIVGKTNLSELAVAPSGINRYYGTPNNPMNRKSHLIPGGSSSGSAVAVADDLADVALGTDTAGSVRVPAAYCGIVGLKTTFGLVSLKGVFPIAPQHLDTVGPLGKDIARTVQGMDLLEEGFEGKYRAAMAAKPTGGSIRVGRLYLNATDPKIDQAIDDSLRRAGFQVVKLDGWFADAWKQASSDGATVATAGAWLNDHFWVDKPGITARTKAVITLGGITSRTTYQPALYRLGVWQYALKKLFRQVDFLALPTVNQLPPRVPPFQGSPLFESHMLSLQNTVAVNFAGIPALAVPVPIQNKRVGLTSLQLVGPWKSEAGLLNAGRIVEAALKKSQGTEHPAE